MPGVFLSYAREDGEGFAEKLRERFAREAPGIDIKQDRVFLEGGIGWWAQVTQAIDSVEFLVLVMTPAALASGNVQKEWRYARQQGVCVYPVKGASDAALQFGKMPRWMAKAHFYDLEKEWLTFVAHLRKGCDKRRVPFMAPELPAHFVERPVEFEALKSLLLNADRTAPVAITTALAGAGGFGKTTLAAALCHDEEIVQNFDDGVLWVTLGETPNVLGSLSGVYAALTGERPGFAGVADASYQLGEKLAERNCLLVVDDVWDSEHLQPFLQGGKSSARLFTTRDRAIGSLARSIDVDQMRAGEAVSLVSKGVVGLSADQASQLAERLGEWPLALELASAVIRDCLRLGEPAERAAGRLLLDDLENPTAAPRHRTISSVLEVSLDRLDLADRRRLAELSIFPEDVAIPLASAGSVWGLTEGDASRVGRRLARLSLVKVDLNGGVMRLHDVMRSWLASHVGDSGTLHERLVQSWLDWRRLPRLPGGYAWRWLPWHLAQAKRHDDLYRILWDPVWIQAKLKATNVNLLIADYELLKPSTEAELLQGALRLSANVLAADPEQFASQMVGRFLPHKDTTDIARFLDGIVAVTTGPWLRPLRSALHPPGTGLVRTLEGHADSVLGVTVTPDGQRAVSASFDNTLKVWDLQSGRVIWTLEGHSNSVYGVAVTPDGRRAVSASYDNSLKVWDLQSGCTLLTLEGHANSFYGVVVTPDGQRAVSASWDNTLKVWDLQSGRALFTLEGHANSVYGVAITPDGQRVVSASGDNTLKVWDLQSGHAVRTLKGHSDSVSGVAITPDGKRAVSSSHDRTLKVWDLQSGRAIGNLEGHSDSVSSVAVTKDGQRAVSASYDNTLKVWDLQSGQVLYSLEGHSDYVSGVAVTLEGEFAVSASWDHTLKVWDLQSGRALRFLEGHADSVRGVAVTPDGKRVVSASWDNTLKVWDLASGRALRTLQGHSAFVSSLAVTPDGQKAVSASWDNSLKMWDLQLGRTILTLEGHAASVFGVAVTPDGQSVVSASHDKTLKVWNLRSGRAFLTLKGHCDSVSSVAVTPDGQSAVSASHDNTLKVWDLRFGRALLTLKGHSDSVSGVAVTPDSRRAISASADNTLKVWDLQAGRALRTLEGHSASISGVAVTPGGRRAVSSSLDKTLKVWDLNTGMEVVTFHCDAGVRCCDFADAQTIVAGDDGGRVHFLRIEEP